MVIERKQAPAEWPESSHAHECRHARRSSAPLVQQRVDPDFQEPPPKYAEYVPQTLDLKDTFGPGRSRTGTPVSHEEAAAL
jgi:hypothetical protein